MSVLATLRRGFGGALTVLTRLPAGGLLAGQAPLPLADCAWAFAPIGGLVGGCGGLVLWLAAAHGLPLAVAAVLALVVQVALTGALHEDGLADFFDGLGGATLERRLAIMRDSRIGSYGVLALLLVTAAKIAALAALPPGRAAVSLIIAGAAGRGAMGWVLLRLPPARTDGLSSTLADTPLFPSLAAALLCLIVAWLLLPVSMVGAALLGATIVAVLMTRHLASSLGGHTGDTLGATAVLAETLVLVLLSAR